MCLAIFPLSFSNPHTLYASSVLASTFLHKPLLPVNTEVVTFSAVIFLFSPFLPLAFIILLAPLFVTRLAIACFEAGVFAYFPIGVCIIVKVTMFAVGFPAFLMVSMQHRITLIMGTSSNFKMVRANAWWIIAEMANLQPLRNRAV